MPKTFQYFLLVLGLLLSVPLLLLWSFVPTTPVSPVGFIYLLSYSLIVLGLFFTPRLPRQSSVSVLVGVLIVFGTIAVRMIFPPSGTRMNLLNLPSGSGPRLINRIFNEQDVVLLGAQIAPYLGPISPSEKTSLDTKFSQTFKEMNARGATPLSPFLTTYLGQQRTNAFDVVVAEPGSGRSPKVGIIFLHGFGGNFTLQCWLMAKAGDQVDAITVCPSTSLIGDWWSAQGQAILQETFTYLHQRGVAHIYLAGLSNGAIGTTRVADQYKDELIGLILISGADPGTPVTNLPVLLLHGKFDERIPVSMMEGYAVAAGPKATYHLFESDHFLLLKQADQVQSVIVNWLREQESTGTAPEDAVPIQ